PDRLDLEFGSGNRHRVERRLSPGGLHGQLGKIDDATVPAKAALIVRRAHEDAIDRARVDAQSAEHALGVVDLEAVHAKALADRVLDLLDVDAVDRAGPRTLVAADARRQIEALKTAIVRLHRHRQFRV